MDSTKCIDNQQWEAYSQNKLTSKDLELLHSHALTCEICADIKEGIDVMQTPANLVQTVKKINTEIDAKVATKKSRILPLFYRAAAASIVLVSTIFMLKQTEPDTLQQAQTIATQESQVPDASPQLLSQQKGKDSANKNLLADDSYKPKTRGKRRVNLEKAIVIDHTEMVMDDANPPQPVMVSTESKSLSDESLKEDLAKVMVQKDEPKVEHEVESKETMAVASPKESSSKNRIKAIYPSNYSNNATNIDISNVGNAAENVLQIDSSLLQLAQLQVKNLQLDSARQTLTPLLANGPLQEEAYWLLAEIYQKQGKTKEYKTTLEKVIELDGKHKKEAMVRQAHHDD
jgi:tetratricopeptide (TPR) repeat protein